MLVEVVGEASGAAAAAGKGRLVVIVDVIDFSTTMEGALAAGGAAIFGAASDRSRPPVAVNPFRVGWAAGQEALRRQTRVVVVAEPRSGSRCDREARAGLAMAGVRASGAEVAALVPNLGAETAAMVDFQGQVVLGVSDSGGVAFDAAFNAGGCVTTATVARVNGSNSYDTVKNALARVVAMAGDGGRGITLVAASGRAWEDWLAARCLAEVLRGIFPPGRA